MPPLTLEDFSVSAWSPRGSKPAQPETPDPQSPDPKLVEESRLAGYEEGYRAGWDDALQTEADEQARIGAEFARNLQDLGFTFHDARSHVLDALEPLLTGLVDKVLPRLVSETLGQTVVDELMTMAANVADRPVEIVIAPSGRAALETFLGDVTSVPFDLVEDPTLTESQVFLRTATAERQIDFDSTLSRDL